MPIPLAAIPAISNAGSGFANFANQQFTNRQSQQWSERMYQRQYDDNIKFWNLQNEYNTPEMQMQRFRSAGLNPNLIYGQGSSGEAGPIKSPEVQRPNFDFTPNSALADAAGTALQTQLDMETRQLTNDNLRADNEIKMRVQAGQEAQTSLTLAKRDREWFDLVFERKLEQISADSRVAKLNETNTRIDLSKRKDAREAVALATSVEDAIVRWSESRQRVAQSKDEQQRIRASTDLLLKDAEVRQLEIDLRREGFSPNDPAWQRVLITLLTRVAEGKMQKPSGISMLKWLME